MSDREEPDEDFEEVLRYLKEIRGFDFTGYKRTSLVRRVRHRMSQVGIDGYPDYIDRLQADVEEFNALFNTILINVTGFFRDPEAWDFLRDDVLPALLAEHGPDDPIRVWSAGCASGEEAYTLAMVLAEQLGAERFRRRTKIYATDVDADALVHARQAVYTTRELEGVPPELLGKYFEPHEDRFAFRKDLRRTVVLGRNDLVQDAPISRIDLLVCRNALMYFNQETQAKVLGRFHFALAPRGVLFLGKAEMLSHGRLFDPIDLKRRIFRKTNGSAGVSNFVTHAFVQDRRIDVGGVDQLREQAFSAGPVAQVVLNGDDVLTLANQQAEALFGLSRQDIGRPLRDLDLSYRPVELRAHVERVRTERRAVRVKEVSWQQPGGEQLWLEVNLDPLTGSEGAIIGVSVVFHDVTATRRLLDDLELANQQLESAYEELQSTNEELETTNEELQSTVEELETTNEELQSTNEELETMNEELQSTNDELHTINDTLRERTQELGQVNGFLESILTSLRAGVIVLDTQMRVIAWNCGAEQLWGVRRDEAEGEHLLDLDIGLPPADLRPVVRQALSDPSYLTEVKVDAIDRSGREVVVRVVCSSLRSNGGEVNGAILLVEQGD